MSWKIEKDSGGRRVLNLPYARVLYAPDENFTVSTPYCAVSIERADFPELRELLGWKAEVDALRQVLEDALAAQNFRCPGCGVCGCGQPLEGHQPDNHPPIEACESYDHVTQLLKLRREAGFKRAMEKVNYAITQTRARVNTVIGSQALAALRELVNEIVDDEQ